MAKRNKKEPKNGKEAKSSKASKKLASQESTTIPLPAKVDEQPQPAAQSASQEPPSCCPQRTTSEKTIKSRDEAKSSSHEHDPSFEMPAPAKPPAGDLVNVERLPPSFELRSPTGMHNHNILLRRSKQDPKTLLYLSMDFDRYDPLPSFILAQVQPRKTYMGPPPISGPIATATWPKPPNNTGLYWDIRLYDPKKPPRGPNDKPILHEKIQVDGPSKHSSNIIFEYLAPQTSTREQFMWVVDTGARGLRRGMKLVRGSGQVVGTWARKWDADFNSGSSEMAFLDRDLGAQFEFLAFMCLVAHKYSHEGGSKWEYCHYWYRNRVDYDKPLTAYWYFESLD